MPPVAFRQNVTRRLDSRDDNKTEPPLRLSVECRANSLLFCRVLVTRKIGGEVYVVTTDQANQHSPLTTRSPGVLRPANELYDISRSSPTFAVYGHSCGRCMRAIAITFTPTMRRGIETHAHLEIRSSQGLNYEACRTSSQCTQTTSNVYAPLSRPFPNRATVPGPWAPWSGRALCFVLVPVAHVGVPMLPRPMEPSQSTRHPPHATE